MTSLTFAHKLGENSTTEWTFGSPRIGNPTLATYFKQRIPVSWRTVNQKDIVPHFPPRLIDFHHVATEVWFHDNDVDFQICNGSGEDPNCSDSVLFPDSVFDHLDYLGYLELIGKLHGC